MEPKKNAATSSAAQPPKKSRVRSPAYPAESLRAAVGRVQKLYNADHESGSTIESAATHMGFNKAHGEALSVLAGLKKFGLIEMRGDRVVVTKRAVNILLFLDQDRGKNALREAVLLPQAYRELFNRFKGHKLPSNQTLRSELIADKGFNPKAVDGFLKDFHASLTYAGISTEEQLNSSTEEPEKPELRDEEVELKAEENEIQEKPETPAIQAKTLKSKVFNVALDPITNEAPQFAQVLIPVPLSDEQKKRLINFLQSL
jgi:hypothetical protein